MFIALQFVNFEWSLVGDATADAVFLGRGGGT